MMNYSQYKKQNKRIHQIGISAIIASIVLGFFAFGFAEHFSNMLTKTLQNYTFFDNNQNINKNSEKSEFIESDYNIKLQSEKSELSSSQQNLVQHEEKVYDKNAQADVIKKTKTDELESAVFLLDVDGSAYEVSKKLAEPAKLKATLVPIDGNFQELNIPKVTLSSDNHAIPIDDGIAKIEGQKIILDFTSPNSWMPDIVLAGTLHEEISKDNDNIIGVIFEDQEFFLSEGDTIPTHVNLKGKLRIDTR